MLLRGWLYLRSHNVICFPLSLFLCSRCCCLESFLNPEREEAAEMRVFTVEAFVCIYVTKACKTSKRVYFCICYEFDSLLPDKGCFWWLTWSSSSSSSSQSWLLHISVILSLTKATYLLSDDSSQTKITYLLHDDSFYFSLQGFQESCISFPVANGSINYDWFLVSFVFGSFLSLWRHDQLCWYFTDLLYSIDISNSCTWAISICTRF